MSTQNQSSFDQFTSVDTPTDEILQQDNAVDELNEFQVVDVWVRGELMHQIIGANERGGNRRFRGSDDCEHVEELLKEGEGSAIIQAAIVGLGKDHPLIDHLGWESGEGNARSLFSRLTNDDIENEDKIKTARKKIKQTLRGCGMRRMAVMRDRVEYHT